MKIAPGATVTIEISKRPSNSDALKTLQRVCAKDASLWRARKQQKTKRVSWEEWRRGGNQWHHQMASRPAAKIELGRKFTVRATLDVIRDLASVSRFVTLSA